MHRYLIAILISVSFIVGCGDDSSSPTTPGLPTSLYPIHLNRQWVYDTKQFINKALVLEKADTMVFDMTVIWGGSHWYGFSGNEGIFWRNGVDGTWRLLLGDTFPGGVAEKYFSYPALPGENWYVESDNDTVSVVSISQPITVEAGTFLDCYYYRIQRADDSRCDSMWVKPGIGIVQQSTIWWSEGDTLESVKQLRRY